MIGVDPALSVRGLDYRYPGAEGNALEGVDLEIAPPASS